MFILTQTREQACRLAQISEEEDWIGDAVHVYEDQQEIDQALGAGRSEYGLVSVWWD